MVLLACPVLSLHRALSKGLKQLPSCWSEHFKTFQYFHLEYDYVTFTHPLTAIMSSLQLGLRQACAFMMQACSSCPDVLTPPAVGLVGHPTWQLIVLPRVGCGQAYGAGNNMAVGTWAQRGFGICLLACLPVSAVWLAAEPLLLMVGQTPAVSHMTASFLRSAPLHSAHWDRVISPSHSPL